MPKMKTHKNSWKKIDPKSPKDAVKFILPSIYIEKKGMLKKLERKKI